MKLIDKMFVVAAIVSAICLVTLPLFNSSKPAMLPPPQEQLQEQLLRHKWRISYFYHKTDKTSHFNNYVLEFKNNGAVRAAGTETYIKGSWRPTLAQGVKPKIILSFDLIESFGDLNEDWSLIEKTESTLRLVRNDSGELLLERINV